MTYRTNASAPRRPLTWRARIAEYVSGPPALGDLVAFVLLFLVAAWCSGCGAGALQAHATAAQVVGIALDGAHDLAAAHAGREFDRCVDRLDDECVETVVADMAPVGVALTSAEVAWSSWVSAIEVAHLSGASDALLAALVGIVRRALESYRALGEALSGVGVTLPELPPMVLAWVGGGL